MWAQHDHNRPNRREAGRVRSREVGSGMMEAEAKVISFQDGESGHRPWNIDDHEKLEKEKDFPYQVSRKQPC